MQTRTERTDYYEIQHEYPHDRLQWVAWGIVERKPDAQRSLARLRQENPHVRWRALFIEHHESIQDW